MEIIQKARTKFRRVRSSEPHGIGNIVNQWVKIMEKSKEGPGVKDARIASFSGLVLLANELSALAMIGSCANSTFLL